jgi:RNA polymerase sigma-70 factor (ECF subfamily)
VYLLPLLIYVGLAVVLLATQDVPGQVLPPSLRGLPLLPWLTAAFGGAAALPWVVQVRRRRLVERARRDKPQLVASTALELPDDLLHLPPALADVATATRNLRCDLEDVVRDARSWQDTRRSVLADRLLGSWLLPEVEGPTYVTRELWEWTQTVDRLPAEPAAHLAELGLDTDQVRTELASDDDFYDRLRRCLRHLELFDRTLRIQTADPFRGTPPTRPPPGLDSGAEDGAGPEADALDLTAAFHRLESRLRRTLRSLGVPEPELDDGVQEVFAIAHRRRHDFDGRAPLEHWLFGIARGVASNMRRRAARDPACLVAEPSGAAPSPAEVLIWHEQLELAADALDGLRPEQREVFVRVDLEGDRITDLADGASTNRSTLYSRLRLARQSLRRALAGDGNE